jgi:acetyl esterase/lipase
MSARLAATLTLILGTAGCQGTPSAPPKPIEAAAGEPSERGIHVPSTISPSAQHVLQAMIARKSNARQPAVPDTLDAWRRLHDATEAAVRSSSDAAAHAAGVEFTEATLGGVPVLDLRPAGWTNNGKVLVYTHGGAYTMFSARSTLPNSAKMCSASGLRTIAVDYTTAPFADWKEIQGQAVAVFRALLAEGYSMTDIALFGDSAGGGLAISTVLSLRELGLGMPAAVVLWSPWADLTNAGDTAHTLREADPTLDYHPLLEACARAFANGLDLSDPRVSPIHADFTKGFPPALIQAGTKEILLSTAVRLHQTLEAAGQESKLDVYEGMWHVFQQHELPETAVAVKKSVDWINARLK